MIGDRIRYVKIHLTADGGAEEVPYTGTVSNVYDIGILYNVYPDHTDKPVAVWRSEILEFLDE